MEALADPRLWTALVLAAGVALGVIQTLRRRLRTEGPARGPVWRVATLVGLQLVAGLLLWLTLHPPAIVVRSGTLWIVTRGGELPETALEDTVVALPEADPPVGSERVPDLATALRRHPSAARLQIVGEGLAPRDRQPLPVPVRFTPPPAPIGFVELTPPAATSAGDDMVVGARIGALANGTAELLDPSGAVVDRAAVRAGDRVTLAGRTRSAGLALFELRLRDAAGRLVEAVDVPVEAIEQRRPRVLLLAGAPDAETKFLRRWAEDSDVELAIHIELGAGTSLGVPTPSLTAEALGRLDLVIVDDRRWAGLGSGQRAALMAGVERGLGLLLRPTGPLPDRVRREWSLIGPALSGNGEAVALAVTPNSRTSEDDEDPDEPPLELTRRDLVIEDSEGVTLLRDDEGVPLAAWQGRGLGRVGVWTVADSFALALTGQSDLYADWWSALIGDLSRPDGVAPVKLEGLARAGERVTVCDLPGPVEVRGPDGFAASVVVDPGTGLHACGGFWPLRKGWHILADQAGRETALFVHGQDAAPSARAFEASQATLALSAALPERSQRPDEPRAPGSPWPWFALLMVSLAGQWWLERLGRGVSATNARDADRGD